MNTFSELSAMQDKPKTGETVAVSKVASNKWEGNGKNEFNKDRKEGVNEITCFQNPVWENKGNKAQETSQCLTQVVTGLKKRMEVTENLRVNCKIFKKGIRKAHMNMIGLC